MADKSTKGIIKEKRSFILKAIKESDYSEESREAIAKLYIEYQGKLNEFNILLKKEEKTKN